MKRKMKRTCKGDRAVVVWSMLFKVPAITVPQSGGGVSSNVCEKSNCKRCPEVRDLLMKCKERKKKKKIQYCT